MAMESISWCRYKKSIVLKNNPSFHFPAMLSGGMLEQISSAYSALLFVVILVGHYSCSATNNCAPSSCGNITNIRYPFRLQTDPKSCGLKKYELGCENNRTTVYLERVKYYVQAIDYDPGFTIRVVDADFQKDDCLLIPRSSPQRGDSFHCGRYYPFHFAYPSSSLTFISCPNPIPSSVFYFVNTSSCNNGSVHSYVAGGDVEIAEIPNLCRIDLICESPLVFEVQHITKMSLIEVNDILAYGFELSWGQAACDYAKENHLNLDNDYNCGYHYGNKRYITPISSDFLSILIVLLIALLVIIDIESLQMPPKPFLVPQQTSNDDRSNMADPASLKDPSNDCSIDSSYQFGR
ncbi:hypothetical protein SADUNF_Sadunf17G0043500 [Salix dunnii]|uniref:Wall-associated receptor kinase galacturonan-binding domain-containing protein n=1 Tax=Salix dunnii TaxID=1413687 RepID=A0A835J2H7_9ROSI|nr:hypothetical protein SADUNF_Sadunf17G0043500 [Salix dunnii]